MNTRLKIICILFGIVYFYFVGMAIIDSIPDFMAGFKEGYNKVKTFGEEGSTIEEPDQTETVFLNIKPISGFFSFPSSIINLKSGNPVRAEFSSLITKVDKTQLPLKVKIGSIVFIFLAFPTLFAIVFIPIQIYRVIRSIVKNEIFKLRNVARIRWIGYCLLFIFVGEAYSNFFNTVEAKALIRLEDYQIIFKMGSEYYWLLFALVTLLFAEILKISHTMKEEQDLTI